jgi:hypothetical protein
MISLLPPNSTGFERAIEEVSHLAVDPSGIKTMDNPATIPVPLLPWLAWAEDARYWRNDFSIEEKRALTAGSWNLHRRAGTLWAFKTMARLSGASIDKAIVPPAKAFLSPSLSRGERNQFLKRYPELRIYRYRDHGQRSGVYRHRYYAGKTWLPLSDAEARFAPRAFLVRDGVETALATTERVNRSDVKNAMTLTEIRIPADAGQASFCIGHHQHYLINMNASTRFHRLALTGIYHDSGDQLRRVVIEPGLAPVEVHYDLVADIGVAGQGQFASRPLSKPCAASTAGDRLYKRSYLFDPEIAVQRRQASLFCGAFRLGMPAFHGELMLKIPGRRNRLSAARFVRGFTLAHDPAVLNNTLGALRDVARAADRIAINTHINRPATAGLTITAGPLQAGAWIAT